MRRHFHLFRVRAVPGCAVNDSAVDTQLRPAVSAMFANTTTAVMMVHHPVADLGLRIRHAFANRRHDATGLMPRDQRRAVADQPERRSTAD